MPRLNRRMAATMTAFTFIVLVGMRGSLAAAPPQESEKRKLRLLLVTQSLEYKHDTAKRRGDELSLVEKIVTELGSSTGLFDATCTQDVAKDFTRERLDRTDVVLFYTTGTLPIASPVLDYFLETWLKEPGHGFFGVHCAADTFKDHRPYWDMLGGTFDGHGAWGHAGPPFTVTVHEPDHPACKPWGTEFEMKDEVYVYRNWNPRNVRVLMSVNMAKTNPRMARHMPMAWCRDFGKGRVFYLTLGHEEKTWKDKRYQESLLGAIRWIAGSASGESKPNPELSELEEKKAKAAFEADPPKQKGK
jgi:uncharacterized protein